MPLIAVLSSAALVANFECIAGRFHKNPKATGTVTISAATARRTRFPGCGGRRRHRKRRLQLVTRKYDRIALRETETITPQVKTIIRAMSPVWKSRFVRNG